MISKFRLCKFNNIIVLYLTLLLLFFIGCKKTEPLVFLFNVNSLNSVISKYNLIMDNEISYDGLGSIRVESEDSVTAYLFILRDIPIRRAKLKWEAYCKTEELEGRAFMEIGVQIYSKYGKEYDTFIYRGDEFISKTTNWTKLNVEFLSTENRMISTVQLNLIVKGRGKVWIDQVKFTATPI